MPGQAGRLPLISMAVLSGAALGYQVLLLRIFSIISLNWFSVSSL